MTPVRIRESVTDDLGAVVGLLTEASLPIDGVANHFGNFLIAESSGAVVGAIGLEVYGDDALLRSAVVDKGHRNSGIGSSLTSAVLARATARGVRRLILLTNTAEEYFAQRGFRRTDITSIRGPIRASSEFTGACPASAVCMELLL